MGFRGSALQKRLLKHFGVSTGDIATAGRQFPITARVDIQLGLQRIKELMRRCAQFEFENSGGKLMSQRTVDAAPQQMLFAGGGLNRKLLGGDGAVPLG